MQLGTYKFQKLGYINDLRFLHLPLRVCGVVVTFCLRNADFKVPFGDSEITMDDFSITTVDREGLQRWTFNVLADVIKLSDEVAIAFRRPKG